MATKIDVSLSKLAQTMLAECPYNSEGLITDLNEVRAILQAEGCPLDHPIIAFQKRFAGYGFKLYGAILRLGMSKRPSIFTQNNHWFCECAFLPVAPTEPIMDESGLIYANESPPSPLATSVQVFIENEAVAKYYQEMYPNWQKWVSLDLRIENVPALYELMDELKLVRVAHASDQYTGYWFGDSCNVQLSGRWDDARFAIFNIRATTPQELARIKQIVEKRLL